MKPRLRPEIRDRILQGYAFYCPGCEHAHFYFLTGKVTWGFNGDLERPTFTPSLLNTCDDHPDPKQRRCHLVLTDGVIHFGTDCAHSLAGKDVPLPEFTW